MAEIEAEFADILEELEQLDAEFSESISVSLDAEEVFADLDWSGNTLEIDLTDFSAETDSMASSIGVDLIPDQELESSFINDASLNELFGPEEVSTELSEASSALSQLQTETEAAELASRSTKFSKLKMVGEVIMYGTGILMGLDWLAGKIASIVQVCIDSDNPPAWAKDMTKEQKDELAHVNGALPKLSIVVKSWMKQWEQYKDGNVDFGTITVTVNSTAHDVPVMYMLFYAFTDMNEVVKNTQKILAPGISDLSIADVIVAANNIFVVLADALSIFNLRDLSKALKAYNFPPMEDKETVDKIITTFKNGRKKVDAVGVKYTRFAVTNAIKTYLQVKVTQNIYESLQKVVLPAMQTAAKQAYKDAAQSHMNDEKAAIRALAFVPGAGIALARKKMEKEQKEAERLGTEAAKSAAEDKLKELRPQVVSTAELEVKKYAKVDQAQLKAIANLAIDSAMGQVKKAVTSSK